MHCGKIFNRINIFAYYNNAQTPQGVNLTSQVNRVVFDGSNSKTWGIKITPDDSTFVDYVEISGIQFQDIIFDAIQVKGYSGKNIKSCNITGCKILNMIGDPSDPGKSSAAIKVQYSDTVNISNCNINSFVNSLAQNDGIYIDHSSNVILNRNIVTVENNYIEGSANDWAPHTDCIQIYLSNNVKAVFNYIENKSILNNDDLNVRYSYRQGLYLGDCSGNIEIYNNLIKQINSDNLINISFGEIPASTKIFNNTLIATQNPRHLVNLDRNAGSINNLQVKNNIFYKTGSVSSNNTDALKFIGLTIGNLNNNMVNYNCYHNSAAGDVTILADDGHYVYNYSNIIEANGILCDTVFNNYNALDYTLFPLSHCKNIGIFSPDITADLNNNNRSDWQKNSIDIGAYELPDAQIKIGVRGFGNLYTQVNHNINASGILWSKVSGTLQPVTSQAYRNAVFVTAGDNDTINKIYWGGFALPWVHQTYDVKNKIADLGLYKITNSHSDANFYLDTRYWDKNENFEPTIYLIYRPDYHRYSYFDIDNIERFIANGSIMTTWGIQGKQPETQYLNNFWSNCLIVFNDNRHPRIIWGKYPDTSVSVQSYKINRKYGGLDWGTAGIVNSNTFTFLDSSITIQNTGSTNCIYNVVAVLSANQTTGPTNNGIINVGGNDPGKKRSEYITEPEYSLAQNYPNPFNPSTNISFSIKEKNRTVLKVYNVLGKEIKTLKDEILEPGQYNVIFNKEEFSSGIYFYSLSSGGYHETKKMILLK